MVKVGTEVVETTEIYVFKVSFSLGRYVVCVTPFYRTEEQEALPIHSGPVYASHAQKSHCVQNAH